MNDNNTYPYIHDAGHGWLQVPTTELEALGIIDEISEFSYQYHDLSFLEEDCDMQLFLRAKGGIDKVHLVHMPDGEESWIRTCKRFPVRRTN